MITPTTTSSHQNQRFSLNFKKLSVDTSYQHSSPHFNKTERDRYISTMTNVDQNVFLGSYKVASDINALQRNNITHIINISKEDECENLFQQTNHFQYKRISIRDNPNEDIYSTFYDVILYIRSAIATGGNVFIHCVKGVSRSPCLCILWLMESKHISFEQALDMIKNIRPIVDLNIGFIKALKKFEMEKGLNS